MKRAGQKTRGRSGFSIDTVVRSAPGSSQKSPAKLADAWAAKKNEAAKASRESEAPTTVAPTTCDSLEEDSGLMGERDGSSPAAPGVKKAKVNNTIRPSVYMQDFVDNHAERALGGLLSREKGPRDEFSCRGKDCKSLDDAKSQAYRCFDCHTPPTLCRSCLLAAHKHTPFHFVQEWDQARRFWLRKPLADVGLVLRLGHEGEGCEHRRREPRPMCIVSEEGIHNLGVEFCGCIDPQTQAPKPDAVQLLEHGLWSATWTQPSTAFTIRLLKTFNLLANQAHINSYDYFQVLRRKTDNVCPQDVTDRYREFMTASRTFNHITSIKRNGEEVRGLVYASLAVLCPACPQPNENMSPGWREREVGLRFLDALFYAVDGNFHASLKDKPMDVDDVPLSKGAAFFADEEAFAAYQKHLGPLGPEPSTCHKFEAMGYGPHWGKVSGTVGIFCARHMMALPGGHVDLQKGERFKNVDFATISGLQRWMDLLMHVSAYDIQCQYRINFKRRIKEFNQMRFKVDALNIIPEKLFPWTVAGVGKFHLAGHNTQCRYKWSFNYLPNSGMVDGEAAERIWPAVNAMGTRTREMNPGYRHDTYNDLYNDQNSRRAHDMPNSLHKKFVTAAKYLPLSTKTLDTLEEVIVDHYGQKVLDQWRVEEEDFKRKVLDIKNHAKLENPYDLPKPSAKTQKDIEQEIQQTFAEPEFGRNLVGVLEEGIALQERKAALMMSISRYSQSDDDHAATQKRLEKRIATWQKNRSVYLEPTIAQATREAHEASVGQDVEGAAATGEDASGQAAANPTKTAGAPAAETDAEASRTKRGKKRKAREPLDDSIKHPRYLVVEQIEVVLPSSCSPEVRRQGSMKAAVDLEISLRVIQAEEALDLLRTHLITSYSLKKEVKKNDKGPDEASRKLRSSGAAVLKDNNVRDAASRYRRAYSALVALGYEDTKLRPLESDDIQPFNVSMFDSKLGQSKETPSWIWQELNFLDTEHVTTNFDKYAEAAIKVHWFRTSAVKSRWEEEHAIVLEEMRRTTRFYKFKHHDWLVAGDNHEKLGRWGHASYARKQAYKYERLIDLCAERFDGIQGVDVQAIRHYVRVGEQTVPFTFVHGEFRYEQDFGRDVD